MQLLKITSTPIKYRVESERASLTVVSPDQKRRANGAFKSLKVNSTGTQNDYRQNVRTSSNRTNNDVQRLRSDRSFESTDKELSDSGYGKTYSCGQSVRIQKNSISGIINQKNGSASIERALDEISEIIPDKSWEPEKAEDTAEASKEDSGLEFEFTPATYKLIVEELANVKIEYLGGINYFPKSSAPDYEDPDIS